MLRSRHPVGRFTHFGTFAEGSALPDEHRGHWLALDTLHNRVLATRWHRLGSTFETEDVGTVLSTDDSGFRPVHAVNAPDGSVLVADFYNHYIAHGQHYQGQIDVETGRVYRLRAVDKPLEPRVRLDRLPPAEWVRLMGHPNPWHRHTAVRLLARHGTPELHAALVRRLWETPGPSAWNSLWALQQSGAWEEADMIRALGHPEPTVRGWTVRWAGDRWGRHPGLGLPGLSGDLEKGLGVPPELFRRMKERVGMEADPEVLSQMAATARRLPVGQCLALVHELLRREDADADPFLPMQVWWALEMHMEDAGDRVLELFQEPESWQGRLVSGHILPRMARRWAVEGRQRDLMRCARLFRMAPDAVAVSRLMSGFEEAYRGRAMTGLPQELIDVIEERGYLPLAFRVRRGSAEALEEVQQALADAGRMSDERALAARLLGEMKPPQAWSLLLEVTLRPEPLEVRRAALAGLGGYDMPEIARSLVQEWAGLPDALHEPAASLLASRASWTLTFLEGILGGQVTAFRPTPDLVERWKVHESAPVRDAFDRWLAADRIARAGTGSTRGRDPAEWEPLLRAGPGDPYAGEELYVQRCAGCHRLFFKGGRMGPDLTLYPRDQTSLLLRAILDPGAEIREGYDPHLVTLHDGRVLGGILVERDARVLVLRTWEGDDLVLDLDWVERWEPTGQSLMPEGLLDDLDDQQVRDLFAYLRISQPIRR